MCGIFAYLNYNKSVKKGEIVRILVAGIRRMEYRGYDSAGLAFDGTMDPTNITRKPILIRKTGKVDDLEGEIEQNADRLCFEEEEEQSPHVGIAHTRWATHGEPSEVNAHPQTSGADNEFLVVHNGIITNYKVLRDFLKSSGYTTVSETDTEVIALLFKYFWDKYNREFNEKPGFFQLSKMVLSELVGAFAIAVKSTHYEGECVVSRRGSPMILGMRLKSLHTVLRSFRRININENISERTKSQDICIPTHADVNNEPLEYFIASDVCAIIEHTREVFYFGEGDVAHISRNGALSFHRFDTVDDVPCSWPELTSINIQLHEIMKGNYDTFMEKEIFEQPESLVNTLRGRVDPYSGHVVLGGLQSHSRTISRCRRLILIACGTSYHSAIAARQLLIEMSDLPIMVEVASDFLDRNIPIYRDDGCVFISQSGETADTLNALRYCKRNQALLMGITNVVGSTVSRETDCGIHINAGPEIGVASTKAYTSQIVALSLMACWLGRDSCSKQNRIKSIVDELKTLPTWVAKTLECFAEVKEIAKRLYTTKSLLVVARGVHVATCLEAALKMKELSYIHTEGIMAGELKHGTLALVDEHLPLIFILAKDTVYEKSINALEQILSRHCRPIVICDDQCSLDDPRIDTIIKVPHVIDCFQPIPFIIPLQMLAMSIAKLRGHNVDFPRNLAKSVTVE